MHHIRKSCQDKKALPQWPAPRDDQDLFIFFHQQQARLPVHIEPENGVPDHLTHII